MTQTIKVNLTDCFVYIPTNLQDAIEELRQLLEAIPAEHRDSAEIELGWTDNDSYDHVPDTGVRISYDRPETDAERAAREAKEAKYRAEDEERRRKQQEDIKRRHAIDEEERKRRLSDPWLVFATEFGKKAAELGADHIPLSTANKVWGIVQGDIPRSALESAIVVTRASERNDRATLAKCEAEHRVLAWAKERYSVKT